MLCRYSATSARRCSALTAHVRLLGCSPAEGGRQAAARGLTQQRDCVPCRTRHTAREAARADHSTRSLALVSTMSTLPMLRLRAPPSQPQPALRAARTLAGHALQHQQAAVAVDDGGALEGASEHLHNVSGLRLHVCAGRGAQLEYLAGGGAMSGRGSGWARGRGCERDAGSRGGHGMALRCDCRTRELHSQGHRCSPSPTPVFAARQPPHLLNRVCARDGGLLLWLVCANEVQCYEAPGTARAGVSTHRRALPSAASHLQPWRCLRHAVRLANIPTLLLADPSPLPSPALTSARAWRRPTAAAPRWAPGLPGARSPPRTRPCVPAARAPASRPCGSRYCWRR